MNALLRKGGSILMSQPADGSGAPQTLFRWPRYVYVESQSPDGRWVLVSVNDASGRLDVMAVPADGSGPPLAVATGPPEQCNGQLSSDGAFVAYDSDESGRTEVYVAPFPSATGKWQASAKGGAQPRWSRDGKELYFIDPDNTLTVVTVTRSGAGLEFGAPQALFQIYGSNATIVRYDVAPDGQSFLVTSDVEEAAPPVTLVTNWVATLGR